jgi:hypothetical protein
VWYSKAKGALYYVGPASLNILFRKNLTLFRSMDQGKTWEKMFQIREKESGYTAFAEFGGKLVLAYESSPRTELAIKPDRIVYVDLGIDI